MVHHTKDKGDLGVACVIADLARNGIKVALPMCEHLPFDIIGISDDRELRKISVKYCSEKLGKIYVKLKNSWEDRNGTHENKSNRGIVDTFALYCPETGLCYYVKNQEIPENYSRTFALRIEPTKNNQKLRIHLAKEYIDPNRIFCAHSSTG